ncbi:uncharacterized protein C19orf44 homolog isoform X1 [Notechis scutatus]|uniref:Uncharacterized protein C19orf44 homolog isoform X1 n=1 Tax=Notechis scutatus TaxID=8663 RepID=A0A6J1U765_9SAUR|nr:uncharacterized protein C19orf44 homolog isoform X1 [Notechis scutatus]
MRRGGQQDFTRAEALLAGKRVVAKGKQEQEGIGKSQRTARASSSSTRCLSVIPTDSDLSNLSSSKSPYVGRENGGSADTIRLAQPGSRFLKQKPQNVEVDSQQVGLGPVTRVGRGADSKGRSNAILRKLAQIESKIQSRKTKQSMEQIPAMDTELSLSESSKDFELRTGGLKFLKKTARLKESVKAQTKNVTLAGITGDSKEDADRYGQEVPPKSKGQEDKFKFQPNGKLLLEISSSSRSLPEESQVNRLLYHSPYSPNRDTRGSQLPEVASCSSSSSMKDSPDTISHNRCSSYQRKSLSEQSIIRSLDELFSEVTDIHNDISSNSDFRVNILSLDELEPYQKTELKEEVIQAVEKSDKNLGGTVLYPANPQSLFKTSAVSLEEKENLEETDISEQLSSSSAGYSPCKEESLNNTEYSEDFEPSSFSATPKKTGGKSSCEKSDDLLDASVHSIQSNLSSPCCPSVALKDTKAIKKIEVKEAAVQTGFFSLAYRLQYDVPAVVGHAVQQSSAEAPSISSHKLNMEAIEALSMYNPSISALNNMLKQNLLLIQQSIEINRHLHASFVASLEEEEYRYHTLEEAKMYIQQHKPLPLTMEQALQELKEYEQMAS